MARNYETHLDGELLVVREGFDEAWADALASDCKAALSLPCTATQRERGDLYDPYRPYARTSSALLMETLGLEALTTAVWRLRRPTDSRVTINCYPPGVSGAVHRDLDVESPVTLLYPDYGAFDCEDLTLEVEPGDIIVMNRPDLWHRGRNVATDYHYSVAIWRPVPMYARAPVPFDGEFWEEEAAA